MTTQASDTTSLRYLYDIVCDDGYTVTDLCVAVARPLTLAEATAHALSYHRKATNVRLVDEFPVYEDGTTSALRQTVPPDIAALDAEIRQMQREDQIAREGIVSVDSAELHRLVVEQAGREIAQIQYSDAGWRAHADHDERGFGRP